MAGFRIPPSAPYSNRALYLRGSGGSLLRVRSCATGVGMPRYKVLKSVAHNIGHSFTSLTNYVGDDYVMGHILRLARLTGNDTLTINLITGEADPLDLLREPILEVPGWYSR